MRLGIDFGTTRTVVSAVKNGTYPVVTFSWKNEIKDYIPSIAAVQDGNLYFGWSAAERLHQPEVRLLEECRERKEGLRYNTRNIMIDVGAVLVGKEPVVLETVQLYDRCRPIIEQSLNAVQNLLSNNDLSEAGTARSIASFYLVGGSVRVVSTGGARTQNAL